MRIIVSIFIIFTLCCNTVFAVEIDSCPQLPGVPNLDCQQRLELKIFNTVIVKTLDLNNLLLEQKYNNINDAHARNEKALLVVDGVSAMFGGKYDKAKFVVQKRKELGLDQTNIPYEQTINELWDGVDAAKCATERDFVCLGSYFVTKSYSIFNNLFASYFVDNEYIKPQNRLTVLRTMLTLYFASGGNFQRIADDKLLYNDGNKQRFNGIRPTITNTEQLVNAVVTFHGISISTEDKHKIAKEFNALVKEVQNTRKLVQNVAAKPVLNNISGNSTYFVYNNKFQINFTATEDAGGSGLKEVYLLRSSNDKIDWTDWKKNPPVKKYTIPPKNAFQFSGYLVDDQNPPKSDGKYYYKVGAIDFAGNYVESGVVQVFVSSSVAKVDEKNSTLPKPFQWLKDTKSQQVNLNVVTTSPASNVCIAFGNKIYPFVPSGDNKIWKFSSPVTLENENVSWTIKVYSDSSKADCSSASSSKAATLNIPVSLVYSVKGKILWNKIPRKDVKLIFGSDQPDITCTTNQDGYFSANLPPGLYRMIVQYSSGKTATYKFDARQHVTDFVRDIATSGTVNVQNGENLSKGKAGSDGFWFAFNSDAKPFLQISPLHNKFGDSDDYPDIIMEKYNGTWKVNIKVGHAAKYFYRFISKDKQGKVTQLGSVYSFTAE